MDRLPSDLVAGLFSSENEWEGVLALLYVRELAERVDAGDKAAAAYLMNVAATMIAGGAQLPDELGSIASRALSAASKNSKVLASVARVEGVRARSAWTNAERDADIWMSNFLMKFERKSEDERMNLLADQYGLGLDAIRKILWEVSSGQRSSEAGRMARILTAYMVQQGKLIID